MIVAALAVTVMVSDALACAGCGCAAAPAAKTEAAVTEAAAVCTKAAAGCTKTAAGCTTCTKAAQASAKTDAHDHAVPVVTTAALKTTIDSAAEVTLVDARFGKYDDGRRIAGATQLGANATDEEIAAALPDKDASIVAYCTSTECPASGKLADRLTHLGYTKVVKYEEGIEGWVAAGNSVTQEKK